MCQLSNFREMYGKTFHNSQALAPAEVLLVSSSPALDGLHDDTIFCSSVFLPEVILKRVTVW